MNTLNIINKSPFEKQTLLQCLDRVTDGSSILLIEDAVVAALVGTRISDQLEKLSDTIELFVLTPDLAARGFSDATLLDQMKLVDYTGFVELVASHDRVHSWL